jgi:hypothetical protein
MRTINAAGGIAISAPTAARGENYFCFVIPRTLAKHCLGGAAGVNCPYTQVRLLAKDLADESCDPFSPPFSLQTFGQFMVVLVLSEFSKKCCRFLVGPLI